MNRRFALIQALVSLVALAAVVWWASQPGGAAHPDRRRRDRLDRRGASGCTCRHAGARRALAPDPRAHRRRTRKRGDCYALTTVGYMGNNVLPRARARRSGWCCCRRAATPASARCISSIVAERVLDVIVLLTIFVVTVYAVLEHGGRAAHQPAGARDGDRDAARRWRRRWRSGCCARTTSSSASRDWLRPLADSPRALVSPWGLVLLAGTFLLWTIEASVYWTVARAVDMDISIGGALYLVALTNFVAALPAAPGLDRDVRRRGGVGRHRLGAAGSAARVVRDPDPLRALRADHARRPGGAGHSLRRLVTATVRHPARSVARVKPALARARAPRHPDGA